MATLTLWTDQIAAWLRANRDPIRRGSLLFGAIVFAVGLYLSLRAAPDLWDRVRVGPFLVLLLVFQPLATCVGAADFQALARLSGARAPFAGAFRVTLFASAANLLPLPGSMATRLAALKMSGVTLRRGTGSILMLTAMWGGFAFAFSAASLGLQGHELAATFGVIGLAILVGCAAFSVRADLPVATVARVGIMRFALVVLTAANLMVALRTVGYDAGFDQTSVLVVAGFLAAAVPAGLGVREAVVALLAPIVGIDPATGFLAATVGRIANMAWLAAASALAGAAARKGRP